MAKCLDDLLLELLGNAYLWVFDALDFFFSLVFYLN